MKQEADPTELVCYHPVARIVHWLVAVLAVSVVGLGWAISGAPRESEWRDLLLLLHRSVGLSILALMVFRALWRIRRPPPPLLPENERLSQTAIAVHLAGQFLVYGLVAVHVAAALMHRIIGRYGILERM